VTQDAGWGRNACEKEGWREKGKDALGEVKRIKKSGGRVSKSTHARTHTCHVRHPQVGVREEKRGGALSMSSLKSRRSERLTVLHPFRRLSSPAHAQLSS